MASLGFTFRMRACLVREISSSFSIAFFIHLTDFR